MIRRVLVALAMVVLVGMPVHAAEWFTNFSKSDWLWQGGSTLATVADWGTTLDIVAKPDQYHETNWYLGEHPSRGKVNKYFSIAIAAQWGIAWALPTDAEIFNCHIKPRRWFQYVWTGVESAATAHNLAIGLRFNF